MPSHRTSTPGRAGQRSGTHSTTTGPEAPVGAKAGPARQQRQQSLGGCANNLFSSHEERPNA